MRSSYERRVRAECKQLLRSLDLTPPLEITELASRLAGTVGREIRLVPWPLERFGMSFPCDATGTPCYVIAYQSGTARWHQDHIICHELGHILSGDLDDEESMDPVSDNDADYNDAVEISDNLPFPGVPRRLRRSCYSSSREHRVELIATVLMEWALVPGCAPQEIPASAAGVGTFCDSLSYRRGWR